MLEKYNKEIENNIYELSKTFAIRIVNLYNYMVDDKRELIINFEF